MKIRRFLVLGLLLVMVLSAFGSASAQEDVELRILWYNDGIEGQVMRDMLDRYQEANPGVTVVLDEVPFADIHNLLQTAVEGGDVPDIARITQVPRFRESYLDITPYVADAEYWNSSFSPFVLGSMRKGPDDTGIYGLANQFTVSGPYVNLTLFEQAGVELPGEDATWADWTAAAEEVAATTGVPYAIAIDRSAHRLFGPAFSMGATFFNEDGSITVDSPGFRAASEMLIDWHTREITPSDVWVSSSDQYAAARDYFVNGQLVMYMAGSWLVNGLVNDIGDTFDWSAVPNPTGDGGSTGMPGGAAMVAMSGTEHPEEVGKLMDWLAQPEQMSEWFARTLFLPSHLGLVESGVEWIGNDPSTPVDPKAVAALDVFTAEVGKIADEAYMLQYSPLIDALNPVARDRLSQVLAGELTLDEAIQRIQEAVDEAYTALQ